MSKRQTDKAQMVAAEWVAAACTLLLTIRCSPARALEAAVATIRKSRLERDLILWDLDLEAAVVADTPEVLGWVAGRLIRLEGLGMETSFEEVISLVGIHACTFFDE